MLQSLPIARLIRDLRPTLVDVGARGGLDQDLKSIAWACSAYGFEPEPVEAARLKAHPQTLWRDVDVLPCAVGGASGTATLFVPESKQGASLLRHNSALVERFGYPNLHISRDELAVETTTLDDLRASGRLSEVDYLKLDIEGAELDVLKAAGSVLGGCSVVKVECSFLSQRAMQPLIWEVGSFLLNAGFEIVDLQDIHRWRRRPVPAHPYVTNYQMPYSRAQLAQCDVLALRRPDNISDEKRLMLIVISSALGFFDYAISVMRATPSLCEVILRDYGFQLEAELVRWARVSGTASLRVAIRTQLRALVPQLRSLAGRLPYGKPVRPY
jgi:FkbM family methyltransferase